MKSLTKKLLLLSGMLFLLIPESLSALAMFSEQTGKSCMACHAQNMPKLNSYGREFALSGYSFYNKERKEESTISGTDVPLEATTSLNVSAVLKARYIKISDMQAHMGDETVGTGSGDVQVLEGSGLYLGGRIAENFGGLFTLQGNEDDNSDIRYSGKLIMSYPALGGYGGVSLISTETNGIFSGMENHNTGLNATLKQFENSYATNAAQATGIANGPATGLQAYYGNSMIFLTVGAGIPTQNGEGIDAGSDLLAFWRVSYEQPIGNWKFMIGTYGYSGNVKATDEGLNGEKIDGKATLVEIYKEGYGFDFEMYGNIAAMSTMTTINYVAKNVVESDSAALLTSYNLQDMDNSASSIEFQINPIKPLGLKVAYLDYENNDEAAANIEFIKSYDYRAYTAGINYSFTENVLVGADYSFYDLESDFSNYKNVYVTATIVF